MKNKIRKIKIGAGVLAVALICSAIVIGNEIKTTGVFEGDVTLSGEFTLDNVSFEIDMDMIIDRVLENITIPEMIASEITASYIIYEKNGLFFADGKNSFNGTDASTVINNALDNLTLDRSWLEKVVVKLDTTITEPIEIPSYTILELQGKLSSPVDFNNDMIRNKDQNIGNEHIVLLDGVLDGNKFNQSVGHDNIHMVDMDNVDHLRISGMTILNGWTASIHTQYCSFVDICNNYIKNSADDGIAVNAETFYAKVIGNTIENTGLQKRYGSPAGIEIQDGSHHVIATNNIIRDFYADGIQVSTHVGWKITHNVTICDNVVEKTNDGKKGIYIAGVSSNEYASNCFVTNNLVTCVPNEYLSGIQTKYVGSSSIIDNTIIGGAYGVRLYKTNFDIDISNNEISEIRYSTGNGIYIQAESDNIRINDNTIHDCNRGIDVRGDDLKIVDNWLYDNGIGIILYGSAIDTYIRENVIEDSSNYDIGNWGAYTVVIDNKFFDWAGSPPFYSSNNYGYD